jgi:tryptophan synthase beta chain
LRVHERRARIETALPEQGFRNQPDERGHFGQFGGRYVAETLMPLILELEREYKAAKADPAFKAEFDDLLEHYVGRPSPLYFAPRLTEELGGAQVWFKRDELNHTGAHKINNCIGQILLAMRMGKTRIIAETGAGQHGVATATVCARFGLPCVIFMGATDVARQAAQRVPHEAAGRRSRARHRRCGTLKDAMNEALRDWVANVHDTFYIIGTAAGPHPYPELVRDFQSVIGKEARAQMLERTGRLPDLLVAAIGGGSNAIGLFHPFLDDASCRCLASRRRAWPRQGTRRQPRRRTPRHPPRQQDLSAAGRGRPDHRRPLDQRRARLSRHRAGT